MHLNSNSALKCKTSFVNDLGERGGNHGYWPNCEPTRVHNPKKEKVENHECQYQNRVEQNYDPWLISPMSPKEIREFQKNI